MQPPGRWRALLVVLACATYARALCDRRARGSPPDGRYILALTAEPDSYVPGEVYTVSLIGIRKNDVTNEFSRFLVSAENSNGKPTGAGSFQVYDSMTKIDPKCPHQVSSSNAEPKTEIQVLWTAPPAKSGCITIKAMVQEVEVWFMDEGPLRKRLCETTPDLPDNQPPIVNPCCACDEAKYEVTFEGLWSRHTHPKDFPANERATKFSDVIGASHTVNYRFWEFGRLASEGLREVAEYGATTMLEKELKAESEHIRTIIKARGIGYPNLNGKTFAVFRVDNRHHLISLVSMISPSPDWIVGVSGLELCLTNCTWVESKVLNLYPYDAGTDNGITYLSPDERTFPPEPVRALRAVADPGSPFHGPDGKPLARLYLARQRLYEKSCDVLSASSSPDEDATRSACAMRGWAAWSACSVTCGAGAAHRQRAYRDSAAARAHGCRRPLTERRQCYGDRRHCGVPSEYEPDPAKPWGPCAVSDWTGWSPCTRVGSSPCVHGLRTRTRRYLRRGAAKRCHQGYRTKPELDQTDFCIVGGAANCTDYDYEDDTPPLSCPVTEWGPWSPCSATCGMGWKMRTRFFIVRPEEQQRMLASLNDIWKKKFLSWQKQVIDEDLADPAAEQESESAQQYIVTQRMEECKYTLTMQETMCVGDVETCKIEEDDARRICILPKQVGPCRGYMERWFFDTQRRVCEPFGYTGCQGNRNNFHNRVECERICATFREELMRMDSSRSMSDGAANSSSKSKLYDIALQDATESLKTELERTSNTSWYKSNNDNVRDCVLSEWTDWSSCLGVCGQHQRKHRSRSILQYPANGGRPCPKKLLKHKKCKLKRC